MLLDDNTGISGLNKMNFGDDDFGQQSFRSLQQREMALALMNQQQQQQNQHQHHQHQHQQLAQQQRSQQQRMQHQFAQGQHNQPSPTGLPSSIFNLYSQGGGLNDSASSLSGPPLTQGGTGGGLDNQNNLLYSDALNRMMPSSSIAGAAGTGGLGSVGNPYGLGGLSDTPSLSLSGGFSGLRGLSTSNNTSVTNSIHGANFDPLSTAFMRDNALVRERLLARGGDLSLQSPSSSSSFATLLGSGTGGMGSREWTSRSLQQQLLAGSQLQTPGPNNALLGGLMGGGAMAQGQGGLGGQGGFGGHGGLGGQGGFGGHGDTSKFPACLPVTLAVPEDNQKLSNHQVLLRNQIEAFKATEDDLTTHTRGRNKPIKLGQVGIRCKHCARLPVARRQKGSTYFPASLHGLYQAAQNMNTTHMQSGLCTEMPPEYKQMFSEAMTNKVSSSVAGRPYWAKTAKQLGLIDTEDGIRFIRDLTPNQIAHIKAKQQQQQLQQHNKGIPARLL